MSRYVTVTTARVFIVLLSVCVIYPLSFGMTDMFVAAVPLIVAERFATVQLASNDAAATSKIVTFVALTSLGVGIPWGWCRYDAGTRGAIGADIGCGLLKMGAPIYVPLIAWLGSMAIGSIRAVGVGNEARPTD
jgi:hypothetical protein